MIVNAFLLDQTLDYIEAHPEEWYQGEWRSPKCGTATCFVGWAAQLAGAEWVSADARCALVVLPNSTRVEHVRGYATTVLGLTERQADILFSSSNSFDDLKLVVKLVKDNISSYELETERSHARLARRYSSAT